MTRASLVVVITILFTVAGCAGRREPVDASRLAQCAYGIPAADRIRVHTISYPARAKRGETVRTIGRLFVERETSTRSRNCEVPFVVDHANYGSSIGPRDDAGRYFYWLWLRCEQLTELIACDGKVVELFGTYDHRDYPGESPGGDRIIDITSVREAVAGPSSASDQTSAP